MATRMKQKAAARKANADKRPRAVARYIRISSRKVKIVIDLIRGKKVDEALAIRDRECGKQPGHGARVPVCGRGVRQSGPHAQALLGSLPRSCRHDPEAHQPHYRRAR